MDNFLVDILLDWPGGTIIGVVIIILILMIALGLGYGLFWLCDHMGAPEYESKGTVINRTYEPPRTQYIQSGKVMIPHQIPESWNMTVRVPQGTGNMEVTEEFCQGRPAGTILWCRYDVGRFSGNVNLISLRD